MTKSPTENHLEKEPMETGTVKWFDATKGFGFVVPSSGGAEIYIHAKVLEKAKLQTLETGSTVTFTVATRGAKAFVEEIALVAAQVSQPSAEKKTAARTSRAAPWLDAEEEFEREWGLRRA